MRSPFFHGIGGVLSADIAVPDHERELGFYSKVLTTGSAPLWRDDLTNPEYEVLPLQWMPHFQVSDVAASAERTLERGGKELMHGKSDNGESQWAVLVDPAGAAFGVIPVVVGEPKRASHLDSIGCISWLSIVASLPSGYLVCRSMTSARASNKFTRAVVRSLRKWLEPDTPSLGIRSAST